LNDLREKRYCIAKSNYGNYKTVRISPEHHIMILKIVTPVFAFALLSACQTTQTAQRQTLEQRTLAERQSHASYAANSDVEPPPPAEGPQDAPEGAGDPNRNPALVPSPLLRYSAASRTP
jgi:hypothetical protein